jgi:cell division protein FtsN
MVARDYKRSRAHREGFSGWAGLFIGLVAGLSVGLALYFFDPRTPPAPDAVEKPAGKAEPASAREAAGEEQSDKYDFYQMLPNFEVVVPEKDKDVKRDLPAAAKIERPGVYVLQAGSYRNQADADRVRAQLALQGVEAKVQRVAVDADVWHRVRIGPISNLDELNRVRRQLRGAEVDALVIRVGD